MAFYPAPGAAADSAAAAASREAGGGEDAGGGWQTALNALARRARAAAALEQPQRVQELTAPLNSGTDQDLEQGGEPRWAAWARQAAGSVRQQAAEAAEQAQRGLERARTVDWSEQVKTVQGNVTRGLDLAVDRAQTAGATFQEKVNSGVERAKSVDWSEHAKGLQQNVSRSFEMVATSASSASSSLQEKSQAAVRDFSGKLQDSQVLQKAREGATSAAGAVRGSLQVAGSRAQGIAALTMSPGKLARFLAVFLIGALFVVLSFNYLPILLLAPQKFSTLFTIGSLTILSSFAVLNGPMAMLTSLAQREKLPFSITYACGLLGTLLATLIMRSYIFTAVFAVVQALSLVYFIATFLPGGRSALSLFWRLGSAGARTIVQA